MESTTFALEVFNTLFRTRPIVVHAHGSHDYKPNWLPIKNAFFDLPKRQIDMGNLVTVITCNNGHPSMGMFERSLDHLGIPYRVFGQGINPWVNSRDKPLVLLQALGSVKTPYVLYADSRDAILIDDPDIAVTRFIENFQCRMLFGADRINWPPIAEFQKYEEQQAFEYDTTFKFLNGGVWIGETAFSRDFFKKVINTPVAGKAPESEQGILKKLFRAFKGEVALDYRCQIIQNIGFVADPIFEINIQQLEIPDKK
jgi:hypothetical protein